MKSPPFAANEPYISFDSQICDDSLKLESEVLFSLSQKTLNEAKNLVLASECLISDIYQVLNASLIGDSPSDSESELSMVPESEFPRFDVDESKISMVPESEFPLFDAGCEDFEVKEAHGSERWCLKAKQVPVMAEEMGSPRDTFVEEMGSPLEPFVEEMYRILLPAYFKRVRSFLFFLFLLVWLDLVIGVALGVAAVNIVVEYVAWHMK